MRIGDHVLYEKEKYEVVRNRNNGMFDLRRNEGTFKDPELPFETTQVKEVVCVYADEMEVI